MNRWPSELSKVLKKRTLAASETGSIAVFGRCHRERIVVEHGEIRKRLGRRMLIRPRSARRELRVAKGLSIVKVAKAVGLGVGTVAKLKDEMKANS